MNSKDKIIKIIGSQNIKPIVKDKTRETVKKMKIKHEIYENHDTQKDIIYSLYMNDTSLYKQEVKRELQKKLRSYCQQDKNNEFYDEHNILTLPDVIELLVGSQLKCNYCREKVYIFYKNVRQANQWTLDRIDNDQGHNKNNCVISCYKCNVQKKKMDDNKFRFSKQLKIIKSDD